MKTKIVYVLVSNEKDIYLEQAYVSMASLRHHMGAEPHITILTDTITEASFKGVRKQMLRYADEIKAIDLDGSFPPQNRSRILKTSARTHIAGDFLFMDCDTIILKSLEGIDKIPCELAACRDSHTDFLENPYRPGCINDCHKLGLDIRNEEKYFNSGVILAKDTRSVHEFYESWNKNWMEGRNRGVNMDQPSFAKTNIELGYPVRNLDDVWNCEFIHGMRYLQDAKVLHYLCTNTTKPGDRESYILRQRETFDGIKKTGRIPNEVTECFDKPYRGITTPTALFAGNAVQMTQTPAYQILKNSYGTKRFAFFNLVLRVLNKISRP